MKRVILLFAIAIPAALAQPTSPTGFGRQIYPGTGGPTSPARGVISGPSTGGGGFGRVIYPGTGAPVAVRPGGGLNRGRVPPTPVVHAPHNRGALVPFPVFYGGGYYGGFDVPYAATPYNEVDPDEPSQRAPVVIINQNFQPETANPVLRDYSNTPLPQAIPREPPPQAVRDPHADDPTIYLIALKDSTVFETVAYWVEGDTLNYITVEGSHNRATLDLVDRERSLRMNDERHVEFKLPKR